MLVILSSSDNEVEGEFDRDVPVDTIVTVLLLLPGVRFLYENLALWRRELSLFDFLTRARLCAYDWASVLFIRDARFGRRIKLWERVFNGRRGGDRTHS